MNKKLILLTSVAILALSMASESRAACSAGAIACGDDCGATGATCHWEIVDGKLSITGKGAMKNNSFVTYTENNVPNDRLTTAPYAKYWDKITSIDVGAGITTTGTNAFQGLSKVTSATISKDVVDLPNFAFDRMPSLKNVTFENGSKLTNIGTATFQLASSLESIDIPKGVTSLGQNAFAHATSLATVNFAEDSKLTNIGSNAFHTNKLTSIDIPDGVTSIGVGAFQRNKLTSVEIPDSVTSIGDSAFSLQGYLDENGNWVPTLTEVKLGDSLQTIGKEAFFANSLNSLVIPSSIKSLGVNNIVMSDFDAEIICKGDEEACAALINNNDKIGKFKSFIEFENGIPVRLSWDYNKTFTNINLAKDAQCDGKMYYYSGSECLYEPDAASRVCDYDYTGYIKRGNYCASPEVTYAKKRYTPAEAAEWLRDSNDNYVVLTFRK